MSTKPDKVYLKSHELYQKVILESVNDGILAVAKDGKVLFANNKFYEMWQITEIIKKIEDKNAFIKQILSQLCEPEKFIEKITNISDTNSTYIENIKFKDGRIFECFTRPLFTEEGSIIGRIWCLRDETEKIRYEEKLFQSEVEKNIILNSTNEVMIYHDTDLKIKWANEAALKEFRMTKEEMIGKYCYKVRHNRKSPCNDCTNLAAIEKGVIQTTEKQDKTGKSMLITSIPIKDKEGNITGVLETILDITKQKEIENSLIKAKEYAEQTSRAKSNFIANMSHEIRTPMNGVLGFIQILEDTKLDEEQKDYIYEMKKASEVLLNVINEILDFSKIEVGMLNLINKPFNLMSSIEDTVMLFAPVAQEKNIEINALIHSDIPYKIIGDPGRLKQILNNLVNNAVKFTNKGEILIEISLKREEKDNVEIEFSVTDTGCGISEDKQDIIFDSFSQVDTSSTRKYGGSGLGLTISKKLVEMMNGTLQVESKENEGSKFSFTIKFNKSEEKPNNYLNIPELKGKKILIADSNVSNFKILKMYLKESGCKVYKTTNPKNICKIIKNNKVDAALIDFNMQFKVTKDLKNIPLILLTSIAKRGDTESAKKAGFAGYLTKPIRKKELLECISIVLLKHDPQKKSAFIVTKYDTKENEFDKKLKILLVEDNRTNQKVALKMINDLGLYCDLSEDGDNAVKASKNNNYDLIFMDCQLPNMTGWEATTLIRDYEKSINKKPIPIIALTAHALEGDDKKCFDAGMNEYLAKPIDKEKLIYVLNKYLNAQKTKMNITSKPGVKKGIEEFMEKTGFNETEATEVFEEFFNVFAQKVSDIVETIKKGNFDELYKKAHSLKGGFANLYMPECSKLTTELEIQAKENNIDNCLKIIDQIQESLK